MPITIWQTHCNDDGRHAPVELEKEFCRATAEEVCLTRLAEEMKRELEALRFEAATQADAREREQQQCCICYDVLPVSAGLG